MTPGRGRFGHIPDYTVNLVGPGGKYAESLYVVEFSNGVIKVGRTFCPRKRVTQLNRLAERRVGARVTRCTSVDTIDGRVAPAAEKRLIERMTRIANPCRQSVEYFSHTRYGIAVTLMRQVARAA